MATNRFMIQLNIKKTFYFCSKRQDVGDEKLNYFLFCFTTTIIKSNKFIYIYFRDN